MKRALLILLLTLPTAARAFDAPASANCTHAQLGFIDANFLPTGLQRLVIVRNQAAIPTEGPPRQVCQYILTLYPHAYGYIAAQTPLWTATIDGPGNVLVNKLWTAQLTADAAFAGIIFDVNAISILPNRQNQLAIHWSHRSGPNTDESALVIVGFDQNGGVQPVLNAHAQGNLDYVINGPTLTLNGYYMPPNGCPTCAEQVSVQLAFNPATNQFAVLNPTAQTVAFFYAVISSR